MIFRRRKLTLVAVDMLIVALSIIGSYFIRFEGDVPEVYRTQAGIYIITALLITAGSFHFFKLYSRIWQYASVGELYSLIRASLVGGTVTYMVVYMVSGLAIPLSVFVGAVQSSLFLTGGVRFAWRIFTDSYQRKKNHQHKALIIGAGDCGSIIAKELIQNQAAIITPVAFIDDDPRKQTFQIYGIPVLGDRNSIAQVVEKHEINDIIIAIPSASKRELSEIIEICKATKAKLKIIPILNDLISGKVSIKEIRDVEVEDLLGREPVKTDLQGIANYVENKTVLVTGAGGSIGSELCRQIAPFHPNKLLLLGHGENSIYNIEMELRSKFPELQLETLIADVQDRERIDHIFQRYQPQVIFHAAAHKHVPLMERNPSEAIKNNVFGTKNVAECADRYSAERFVLISTDKAVNPTSVMGTTKRIAEMLVQSLNATSTTVFAAVRFGNVLGSRGSVIPRFKQQIRSGGPVTVTHPDMIRYFMTIPEAVQLVIQAGAIAKGGEVFILDMGAPVKISDLARDLIRLSGFEPGVDIQIEYSGVRPGEKLFEELLTSEEGISSTKHNRIFIGKPTSLQRSYLEFEIKKLDKVMKEEPRVICEVLQNIVPTFNSEQFKITETEEKELSLV
ncbi:polysaccharide biosynthesis protein [Paenibacillus lutrae]|uniref:NAD-dependent epimerase/dehydratase family protein n=1 Tax=Paenibacillus lutrae TaxID=2078573 RepID=A0A7X3FFB3_9BACL|nr:nucleoside-diphosphate sugar epimerase/dehydratase [Paenibacillus lutrae]MVO98680.1 NAD-dependent epimerase/dehydratase family protein [Paenibacillus lutrae]